MWRRIVWDILCLVLVFVAPWWVVFIFGVIGVVFFQWYLEIIFLGVLFDVLYGGVAIAWWRHLLHTIIFTVPLLVAEFIKPKLNL